MSKGSTSAEFWYGPDRARVLQVATRSTESERTVYLGALYERTVITPNTTGSATTRHVHYVRAGDETVAIKTWSKVGVLPGHYEKGIALAQAVSEKVGVGNLIIVGHSLGGGLASAAAIATGARAITFNAAGLNRYYRNGSAVDIRAHYTRGDILNMVQRYSPLPNSVGAQVPHTPAWSKDPISRHGVF
jgi:pimeloyl-ACP methyl ester carboxylesterase